jgi:hypothetical protein
MAEQEEPKEPEKGEGPQPEGEGSAGETSGTKI